MLDIFANRFLTEDMFPSLETSNDECRLRSDGQDNHDTFNLLVVQDRLQAVVSILKRDIAGALDLLFLCGSSQLLGGLGRPRPNGVQNRVFGGSLQGGQVGRFGEHAGPDDGDVCGHLSRRMWRMGIDRDATTRSHTCYLLGCARDRLDRLLTAIMRAFSPTYSTLPASTSTRCIWVVTSLRLRGPSVAGFTR